MPNDNDVTITQADRQAAFDLFDQIPGTHGLGAHMLEGIADNSAAIQAFARHRIAALSPPIEAPNLSREVEAEKGWQPIETAPKDGTRVLLWSGRWTGPACGIWVNAWTVGYDLPPFLHQPTHWMPLPSGPGDGAGRGE